MSLHEVTLRSFQNGIGEIKWGKLCKHIIEKNSTPSDEAGAEISNCILELFGFYPADILLIGYLKHALHVIQLFPLSTFVTTFLEAAKSPNLHDAATLNMLCRLIQEEYYASGLPADKILIQVDEASISKALEIIRDALDLLRTAFTLPSSPFHNPVTSASQLVRLLLSGIGNMNALSTSDAMVHYANALEVMQQLELDADVRAALEGFALSLNMILGDDAKMAQEAQMMHTLQMSLGKGDVSGPNSQSDLVSCSLILRHLVETRSTDSGCGSPIAAAWLVALFRWTSWTPKVFYTQLFLAAVTILTQSSSHENTALLWRSFIITRLTQLLCDIEKILSSEAITDLEWRNAVQAAFAAVHVRGDLLAQCDTSSLARDSDEIQVDNPESSGRASSSAPSFFQSLVQYCAHRTTLMDSAAKMSFSPFCEQGLSTILTGETIGPAAIEGQIEERMSSDLGSEEHVSSFLSKALKDVPNHQYFAIVLQKKVQSLCQHNDVEGLGTLCKALNSLEMAIDIVSLHVKLSDILARVLAFVEDFDCDTVGDPQTAVGHLGSVILFLQDVLIKYQFSHHQFNLEGRVLSTHYLLSTSAIFRVQQLNHEEMTAMRIWGKSLFDANSEGIEDSILKSTKPKTLLKLAASFVLQPSVACAERRMEADTLKNGISYFTGPLLNWTLVGVIKALLRDVFDKDFNAPVHLEVLQTLVEAESCPQTVLKLTGHGILTLISHPKASSFEASHSNTSFKPLALKAKVRAALKLPAETSAPNLSPLTLQNEIHWLDQPRKAILDAMALARTGRAPAFDVGRCVSILGPTRFIRLLWTELEGAAQLGDMELSRRLATYILLCPPAEVGPGAGRTPPLLPIFLTSGLQFIIARLDSLSPTEQTLGTELLVVVITSTLTGLLQFEWAMRAAAPNSTSETPSYRSSVAIGRRLAADMKRSKSPSAGMVLQRITSSSSFIANFPMMAP